MGKEILLAKVKKLEEEIGKSCDLGGIVKGKGLDTGEFRSTVQCWPGDKQQ